MFDLEDGVGTADVVACGFKAHFLLELAKLLWEAWLVDCLQVNCLPACNLYDAAGEKSVVRGDVWVRRTVSAALRSSIALR